MGPPAGALGYVGLALQQCCFRMRSNVYAAALLKQQSGDAKGPIQFVQNFEPAGKNKQSRVLSLSPGRLPLAGWPESYPDRDRSRE